MFYCETKDEVSDPSRCFPDLVLVYLLAALNEEGVVFWCIHGCLSAAVVQAIVC